MIYKEATDRDKILKYLKKQPSKTIDLELLLNDRIIQATDATIEHHVDAMGDDGRIKIHATQDGKVLMYLDQTDYFLEQGGYEEQFYANQQEELKLIMRLERQYDKDQLEITALKSQIRTNRWSIWVSISALVTSLGAVLFSILL